ncbi:hypothetical protein VTK56DRAFT_340 [Thermocarpiscus australiensis]
MQHDDVTIKNNADKRDASQQGATSRAGFAWPLAERDPDADSLAIRDDITSLLQLRCSNLRSSVGADCLSRKTEAERPKNF